MELISIVFSVIALVFSVIIHEVAHGAVANKLGDPTAKFAGRLSLNPLKHLDWMGSVILPLLLVLVKAPVILGWAKPVPVNPLNFRDKRWGDAKVAAAGAAANFAMAAVFGLILRFWPMAADPLSATFSNLLAFVVSTNIALGIFNLLPFPPLDGSHILFAFLPPSQADFKFFLQKYGPWILLGLLFIFPGALFGVLWPIIEFLYRLITGAPLM